MGAQQAAGHDLGPLNPKLYVAADAFTDVTIGNNAVPATEFLGNVDDPGNVATPGYDLVSGPGSPDAAACAPSLRIPDAPKVRRRHTRIYQTDAAAPTKGNCSRRPPTGGLDGGSCRWQHDPVVPLRVIRGDATSPQAKGPKIIAHICNDLGGWGKGFVLAISRRWPEPERAYRQWHRERSGNDFGLGATQLVQVQPDTWVANMVAQHGIRSGSSGPPIRYDAVAECLSAVAEHAARLIASVHMPRIGCGLAGGRWDRIEPLIVAALCDRDIATTVYDYE